MNYPKYVEIQGKRYEINTSFKTALKCQEIATEEGIGNFERALAIIYTLFGESALKDQKNHEKLLELAGKYLCCNQEISKSDNSKEPDMDYIQDYDYIKASFRSDYNINLDKEDMHWWEFFNLLNGLSNSEFGNCCVLNRVRNLRNYDTSQIKDPKEKQKIEEEKQKVSLKKTETIKTYTQEQLKNMEEFRKLIGKE